MKKIPFGKTGFDVSALGFGAAPAAYLKADTDRAVRVINTLLDQGLNLLDTATSYPGSQEFLGEHFADRRADYIFVSKCGQKVQGCDASAWTPEVITYSVDLALRQLRTDHLDVMLLHSCDLKVLQAGDAVGALVKARDAGKIRFLGYSGDNEAATYAAGLAEVAVIETSVNIVDQVNLDGVVPVAQKNNVGVIAKRPIANACWKELTAQPGMYQRYAATYTDRLSRMKLAPADLGFSGDPADIWPEIALRFTLSQPGVSTAIVGTTNPENARKNLEIADKGPLPDAAVQRLRDAFRQAADSSWTGQT